MLTTLAATLLITSHSASLQALKRVEQTYRAAGDIQAEFTQTYVEKLRGKTTSESGRLWAKQDGRMRWQYLQPERKDFVFDGKDAYFYEPEKSQVTVFENFKDCKISTALSFLVGRGKFTDVFSAESCTAHCDLGEVGDVAVRLVPKEPLASVDSVLIFIDPKTNRVRLSVLFDSLQNRTEYRFEALKFHAVAASKKFEFKTPPGVQELIATCDGLKKTKRKPKSPSRSSDKTRSP